MTQPTDPATDVDIERAEKLAQAATPEPMVKYIYEHGGGRMMVESPRNLVLDAYSTEDREFYFSARQLVPALCARVRSDATELAALRSQLEAAQAGRARLAKALEPVRLIYCPFPETSSKGDYFERGCDLTPKEIRAMQDALLADDHAAAELLRAYETLAQAADRLTDNLHEFDALTDSIFVDNVDEALQAVEAAREELK